MAARETDLVDHELDGENVSPANFPLPRSLEERLRRAAVELHQGKGLCVIRGLDPAHYRKEDNLLIFLGLANYMGEKRGEQDRKRNVICKATPL